MSTPFLQDVKRVISGIIVCNVTLNFNYYEYSQEYLQPKIDRQKFSACAGKIIFLNEKEYMVTTPPSLGNQ